MSTLLQMRENTRTDLIIDPNGDIWSDDTINRLLNRYIAKVYSWQNLDFEEVTGSFTLVDGTTTYDLNSELTNYGMVQSLRLDGRTNLLNQVADLNDFENTRDLTTEGEPGWYYFYGDNTVGLYPTPDGEITTIHARFNRSEPTLIDSESPAWNSRWHHVAEFYARWQCFKTVPGHESSAAEAEIDFLREEAKMKNDIYKKDVNGLSFKRIDSTVWPK